MEFKSKEDILAFAKAMEEFEDKVRDTAEELGFIDRTWRFESYEIVQDSISVTVYDYCYDLHDTRTMIFPIECIYDKQYLEEYKRRREEERKRQQEEAKLRKLKQLEGKEKAELQRLKAKYEL